MISVESLPAAGRELDALVAERVMGWIWVKHRDDVNSVHPGQRFLTVPDDREFMRRFCLPATDADPVYAGESDIPRYSTDIAAAWQVVEKLQHGGPWKTYWWSLETQWLESPHLYVARILEGSVEVARGDAQGMAEAICLAALKAVAP